MNFPKTRPRLIALQFLSRAHFHAAADDGTAPHPLSGCGAVYVARQVLHKASRRTEMACATAARVARVSLSGLSIMKSCVMPS